MDSQSIFMGYLNKVLETLGNINGLGSSLHKHHNAVSENGNSGKQNQEGKDEGADGVSNMPLWFEEDDDRSNHNTNT